MDPAEPVTRIKVAMAPASLRKVCAEWNVRARAAGESIHVSAAQVAGPSGRVNHHLRMTIARGRKMGVSLGAIDKTTVHAAIKAMLAGAGVTVRFQF